MPLRKHQSKARLDMDRFFESSLNQYGVVTQPTGAGKSHIIADTAATHGKIIVSQPDSIILQQNRKRYSDNGYNSSVFCNGLGQKNISDVTFGTMKSMINAVDRFKEHGFNKLLVDECHLGAKNKSQIDRFCKELNIDKVVGLTATPTIIENTLEGTFLRTLDQSSKSFWQEIVHVTQIQEMVDNKWWTPLRYYQKVMDDSMLKKKKSGQEYTDNSLQLFYTKNKLENEIINAVNFLRKECGCKNILVFVSSVAEARKLQRLIDKSVVVWGEMDNDLRTENMNLFENTDKVDVAININVLGTGYDLPKLDGIVHAGPSGSIMKWYQHIGRLVRILQGKLFGHVVDLSGNLKPWGKIEHLRFDNDPNYGWSMFAKDKILTGINLEEETEREIIPGRAGRKLVKFGKHKGKNLNYVLKNDPSYVKWMASSKYIPRNYDSKLTKQSAIDLLKEVENRAL